MCVRWAGWACGGVLPPAGGVPAGRLSRLPPHHPLPDPAQGQDLDGSHPRQPHPLLPGTAHYLGGEGGGELVCSAFTNNLGELFGWETTGLSLKYRENSLFLYVVACLLFHECFEVRRLIFEAAKDTLVKSILSVPHFQKRGRAYD